MNNETSEADDSASRRGIAAAIIVVLTIFGIVLYYLYSRNKRREAALRAQQQQQVHEQQQRQAFSQPRSNNGFDGLPGKGDDLEMSNSNNTKTAMLPERSTLDFDDSDLAVRRATSRMSDTMMPAPSLSRSRIVPESPATPNPDERGNTSRFLEPLGANRSVTTPYNATPVSPLIHPALPYSPDRQPSAMQMNGRSASGAGSRHASAIGLSPKASRMPSSRSFGAPNPGEPAPPASLGPDDSAGGKTSLPAIGDIVLATKNAHTDNLQVACVAMAYPNGSYLIQFEDGDVRDHVAPQLLFRAGAFRVGQRVDYAPPGQEPRAAIISAYEPMKRYTLQVESTSGSPHEVRRGVSEPELRLSAMFPGCPRGMSRKGAFAPGDRVKKLNGRRAGTITGVLPGAGGAGERYSAVFGKGEEVVAASEIRPCEVGSPRVHLPRSAVAPRLPPKRDRDRATQYSKAPSPAPNSW